jgi:hypothetical protein
LAHFWNNKCKHGAFTIRGEWLTFCVSSFSCGISFWWNTFEVQP